MSDPVLDSIIFPGSTSYTYEAEVIRQLGRFFTKGAVYHGEKPVHWCYSCKTALAEAEVEYADRTDPSIYVKLAVDGLGARVPALEGRRVFLPIWTTTPYGHSPSHPIVRRCRESSTGRT